MLPAWKLRGYSNRVAATDPYHGPADNAKLTEIVAWSGSARVRLIPSVEQSSDI
jgi:hypothetical protein